MTDAEQEQERNAVQAASRAIGAAAAQVPDGSPWARPYGRIHEAGLKWLAQTVPPPDDDSLWVAADDDDADDVELAVMREFCTATRAWAKQLPAGSEWKRAMLRMGNAGREWLSREAAS